MKKYIFDFKKTHTVVVMYKAATYYLLLKKRVNGFVKEILIGMFRIPDGPGKSTIARLMRVNFFAETKTNS